MKRVVIFAVLALATLAPLSLFAGYEEGYAAAQKGLYKKAAEEFQKGADKGDARAQYSLGIMYFDGIGVKKDRETAMKWIRKAADKGHEYAREVLKRNQ